MELREGMVVILRDNYWLLLYQISSSPTILRNEFLLVHALAIVLDFSCVSYKETLVSFVGRLKTVVVCFDRF